MDLTEAEYIKTGCQEYTGELYKKDLNDWDNHDGVITHLEPDILECEVKWALGSITANKTSGGDGIPAELFQILKYDAVKVAALNMPANVENAAVFIPIPKKGNARECSNYWTVALISHNSKVMPHFFKLGFSNTWTVNFQIQYSPYLNTQWHFL